MCRPCIILAVRPFLLASVAFLTGFGSAGISGPPQETAPRPSAERVARRAMVLALIIYRASLEQFPGQADYEALHRGLPAWVEQLGLASELEKEEQAFLTRPLGKADEKVVRNAHWRVEGLGVLAWALKRTELPRHDELVHPRKLAETVGFSEDRLSALDTAAAQNLFRNAELRPATEIDRLATQITIVNWRLRAFLLIRDDKKKPGYDPKRMEFAGYLRAHPSFKQTWLEGLRLVKGDLAIGKKAIGEAPAEEIRNCASLAVERQQAAYWLQGDHGTYSKVDTPTILTGLP